MVCISAIHLGQTLCAPTGLSLFAPAKALFNKRPWLGEEQGPGTAHPERLRETCARCHTHGARTEPSFGAGRLWSCWKEASSPRLLELEKRPSAGSTQVSQSRAAWPDDSPGSLSTVDGRQRGFLISRCF